MLGRVLGWQVRQVYVCVRRDQRAVEASYLELLDQLLRTSQCCTTPVPTANHIQHTLAESLTTQLAANATTLSPRSLLGRARVCGLMGRLLAVLPPSGVWRERARAVGRALLGHIGAEQQTQVVVLNMIVNCEAFVAWCSD